jgi:superfamily II DNA or RNA helicase
MCRLAGKLNPMQEKAVTTTEGPVLIIAGPGSGKTHTLVERITYLIQKKNVKPEEILICTTRVVWKGAWNVPCASIGHRRCGEKGRRTLYIKS